MPNQPTYRRQVLDHLGLIAGMFDELGIGDVLDQATQHDPEMRDLTVGEAVNAMVRKGLGFINQARYLVSRFFHKKPTSRLISPRVAPEQLNDDALGRTLDTRYASGVTELYRLSAVSAAACLGLRPTSTHLDTTSVHVDGRYNSDEEPEAQGVHLTQGSRRDHRPDLHPVVLEWSVAHQAGIPVLMQPRSGHSSEAQEFGQVIRAHSDQFHTTEGVTYVVADSARYREENRDTLAQTAITWISRVPATLPEAQAVLTHADPQAMAPRKAGSRDQALTSTYGGGAPRWVLISAESRQPQAPRTVDKPRRQQRDRDVKPLKQVCGSTVACEAEARQALLTVAQGVQATVLHTGTVCAQPRYGKRGRPGRDAHPDPVVYPSEGALASAMTARQALSDQHRGFILATHARDETQRPPQAALASDTGQVRAERGLRFLKDPPCFASSLSLKKPERSMALFMVMTVCLVVYAAFDYRLRKALKDHEATFPDQKGNPIQHPTARGVCHSFVGIHILLIPGHRPLGLNLTEEHQRLLRLLGKPDMWFDDIPYS
jgi:transposase